VNSLSIDLFTDAIDLVAVLLLALGLKGLSKVRSARTANGLAALAMGLAVVGLLIQLQPSPITWLWIAVGSALGGLAGVLTAQRVPMTAMPEVVALFNGCGGMASLLVAVGVALFASQDSGMVELVSIAISVFVGAITFSGSIVAMAKLQGWLDTPAWTQSSLRHGVNIGLALLCLLAAVQIPAHPAGWPLWLLVGASSLLGIGVTLPIGGADMPVVISLYNALTGLAVAFEGYVLQNEALMIAGMVVGAAGMLLTQLMAKAMNRSLASVLFGSFGATGEAQAISGSQKPIEASDVAAMMAYAERVVIVPGYGMAVAQAQHKVWELTQALQKRGVQVKFAIHPVAGRMPGHMNVLLAEAGVPYDIIADMDDINPEFPITDVALVIGANDVVNPVAKTDPASPIYGMPILDVSLARNVIVVKRGKGTGFAGIENALFYADNARMLYGDASGAIAKLIGGMKELDGGH
jgi:NAD(P) transhydrogenase subunit beta